MSFVKKIGQTLGLVPKANSYGALPPAPVAPTVDNSSAQLDQAAQTRAASMQRGATSTMLTGGMGEDETKLKTSKVLLGQ